VDQLGAAVRVDLLPDPCDVDVDHVVEGRSAGRLLPDVAREHFAGDDRPVVAQQVLQQLVFTRRELDRLTSPGHGARGNIDFEIADTQPRRFHRPTPPHQRAQSGQQLGEGEGLDEIVVCADVQACDSIFDRVPCCQDQHRRAVALPPECRQHIEPGTPR
jgi:hypothetical protein